MKYERVVFCDTIIADVIIAVIINPIKAIIQSVFVVNLKIAIEPASEIGIARALLEISEIIFDSFSE